MNKVTYKYRHFGIPTNTQKPDERYSSKFKMYTTSGNNEFHIQWHRFEKDCPFVLIETQLSEENIWSQPHKGSVIYPENEA